MSFELGVGWGRVSARLHSIALVGLALCLAGCDVYHLYGFGANTAPEADGGGTDASYDRIDASDSAAAPLDAADDADAAPDADAGAECEPGPERDCCESDPQKIAPGLCGCGVPDDDTDKDGTPDCNDKCPQDAAKLSAGSCGCGLADNDSDGDGVLNCNDGCPNDRAKNSPGVCGCGVSDQSLDGDGTPNCIDGCPEDSDKAAPGVCGCGVSDRDADADGAPDCNDGCPNDASKLGGGLCGCGVADTDSDSDGTANCNDACPNDGAKLMPGVCGCGALDVDSDSDGALDCQDACPNDASKQSSGACGCGVAETDSDSDGTPNCNDGCPADPGKTAAGVCGCGFADATSGCLGLRSALAHRYSFEGTGTAVTDAKGGTSGTVRNTQLSNSGSVVLAGVNQYVDLPTNVVSTLTNATIEAWVTWDGGSDWQRVFDFGNASGTAGQTYLFLTTSTSTAGAGLRAAYSTNSNTSETTATAASDLPSGGIHHVAVVVDDSGNRLALYRDGALVGENTSFAGHLSSITYSQCWLGRSHYSADAYFDGAIHELRVYNAALTVSQLATSFQAGPDATFF